MKLLKYIAKEVWLYFWLVLFALMSMQFFLSFLNELGDVGKGHYTIGLASLFCLLELPARAYEFLPIMLFIGGLLAFGDLANHNELIVMRVSGLKNAKLLSYIIIVAITMGILTCSLFEIIAPKSQRYASFTKEFAISNGRMLKSGQSMWLKDEAFYIHAKAFLDKEHFRNVYVYQMAEPGKLKSIALMKRLDLEKDNWVAYDYKKTIFNKKATKSLGLARVVLPMQISNLWLIHSSSKELAEEMSLRLLWKRIRMLEQSHLNIGEWLYNFCNRLTRPLVSMIMLMLALPFVLGSTRHQSLGFRLTLGLVLGLCYHFLNKFLYVFAMVYHINPIAANAIPLVLSFSLGIFVWKKVAD